MNFPSTSSENLIKSRKIVNRLKNAVIDSNDSIFDAIRSTKFSKHSEKQIGIDEITKIREEVKKNLKNAIKFGEQDGFLRLLSAKQFEKLRKQSLELLISGDDNQSSLEAKNSSDNHSRFGEEIVVEKIQVVPKPSKFLRNDEYHPEPPRPKNIPPIDIGHLREEMESHQKSGNEDNDSTVLLSGDPIPSPSMPSLQIDAQNEQQQQQQPRIEVLLKKLAIAEEKSRKTEEELRKRQCVIQSRPRIIATKSDFSTQTDLIEEKQVKISRKDVGISTDPIEKTPRIDDYSSDDEKSTRRSEISEGEIISTKNQPNNVIIVKSDGSIVNQIEKTSKRPRITDYSEDDDDNETQNQTILLKNEKEKEEEEEAEVDASGDELILAKENKDQKIELRRLLIDERTISTSSLETNESRHSEVEKKMESTKSNSLSSDADDESNSI